MTGMASPLATDPWRFRELDACATSLSRSVSDSLAEAATVVIPKTRVRDNQTSGLGKPDEGIDPS